jgi:hypothetical protein
MAMTNTPYGRPQVDVQTVPGIGVATGPEGTSVSGIPYVGSVDVSSSGVFVGRKLLRGLSPLR